MKKLLECAMDIGEQMLVSGAEVHRVEDSMNRICQSFGAKRVDVFIITSSMVVTLHDQSGEVYTQTRRIKKLGTDFRRLDHLNRLSRKICTEGMGAEEIRAQLDRILAKKPYPLWVEFIAYAVIASTFSLFFGGDWRQFFVAVFVGAFCRLAVLLADYTVKNLIFSKFLSTFSITALSYLFVRLGVVSRADEIIIGNIMLLIPGIGFTNALRDLFTGDSIAGALRLMEAVLCAVAIAAGYYLFVFITGGRAV